MKVTTDTATPAPPKRPVSLALALGVLFLPVVFIWFLFRAGYSARAQIIGCIWMGVVGTALLISAPKAPPSRGALAAQTSGGSPPMVTTILDAPGGSPQLALELGETRSVNRLLRTPVTLTNNIGSDLKYAEVLCVFYATDGKLLGNGLGNWAAIGAGKVVSGEIVASNIELEQVGRRECRARSLKA